MKFFKIFISLLIIASFLFIFVYPQLEIQIPFLKTPKKISLAKSAQLLPYPIPTETFIPAPQTSAISATVIDNDTGLILYEKEPNLKRLPASTTKLMTALVALENCLPQTAVQVGYVEKEGSQMGLETGDVLTVENLLYGLLVNSGNDAAFVLAYSCADSYEDFIKTMNKKADSLGMENTHFANPAGFDEEYQFSTASDLTKLSRAAVANPLISKIVKTRSIVVNDVTGTKTYFLENVNKLLGIVPGLEGVKTGQTEGALENLVTYTNRDGKGVITVVLGSLDRFGESQSLIEWAYGNHVWVNP